MLYAKHSSFHTAGFSSLFPGDSGQRTVFRNKFPRDYTLLQGAQYTLSESRTRIGHVFLAQGDLGQAEVSSNDNLGVKPSHRCHLWFGHWGVFAMAEFIPCGRCVFIAGDVYPIVVSPKHTAQFPAVPDERLAS